MKRIDALVDAALIELPKLAEGREHSKTLREIASKLDSENLSELVLDYKNKLKDDITTGTMAWALGGHEEFDAMKSSDRDFVSCSIAYNVLQALTLPKLNPEGYEYHREKLETGIIEWLGRHRAMVSPRRLRSVG